MDVERSACHVIICVTGTKGDVHPFLGIATELKKRGFKITFLGSQYFENLIKSFGFLFQSTGTAESFIEFHSDPQIWDPKVDIMELGYDDLYRPAMVTSYNYVVDEHKNNPNVAVIGMYPFFNGALLAAEALGITGVSITLSPRYINSYMSPPAPTRWYFPSWYPGFLIRPVARNLDRGFQQAAVAQRYTRDVNKFRESLGLKLITKYDIQTIFSKNLLQIALFPKWFGMPAPDWPSNLKMVGFPMFDEINDEARAIVDEFISLNGCPILFTAGTGFDDVDNFFTEAIKICSKLNVPGLFVGGKPELAKLNLPSGFCHLNYVDFGYVLPKCRAIIHHGGIGTLSQAVKAGILQFIRPYSFDQHDNADRIFRLKLGAYMLPHQFCEQTVTPILKALLESKTVKKKLSLYSSKITTGTAIYKACDLIESKIAQLKPKKVNHIYIS